MLNRISELYHQKFVTDYQEYQQSLFKAEESVENVTKDTEIGSVGKATFIDTPGFGNPDG